jgi:hypothetical protein
LPPADPRSTTPTSRADGIDAAIEKITAALRLTSLDVKGASPDLRVGHSLEERDAIDT